MSYDGLKTLSSYENRAKHIATRIVGDSKRILTAKECSRNEDVFAFCQLFSYLA